MLQTGTFYRGRSFRGGDGSCLQENGGNTMEWTCVSADQKRAVGLLMQKLVVPNSQFHYYKPKGLLAHVPYHFYNKERKYNIKNFGDLVNMIAPVHIRQDSLVHNVAAKLVKMDGEKEDLYAYGDTLMYGGVRLKQAFGGTGYNDQVRYYQDFESRLYFMEAEG